MLSRHSGSLAQEIRIASTSLKERQSISFALFFQLSLFAPIEMSYSNIVCNKSAAEA